MALDYNTVVSKILIDFIFHMWVWLIFVLFEIGVVIKSIDWMGALLDDIDIVVSVEYMRTLGYPGDDLLFAP